MADIFISYKKEDAGRVIRMVEALRADGFDVWWDHGIKAGSEWDRSIHKELYSAKVVIAIWSNASVAAPWVKEEATVGKNRGVLVPAKIDDVDPPLGFMMIQAADLTGWSGDRNDPRWAFFLEAVREHPAQRLDADHGGAACVGAGGAAAAGSAQPNSDPAGRRWNCAGRRCGARWTLLPGRGPAPVVTTPAAVRTSAAAAVRSRRPSLAVVDCAAAVHRGAAVASRRSPTASRSSGTGRWRTRPARASRPI